MANNCSYSHYILDRQALAIKNGKPVKNVLDETVQIINFVNNFVKYRPLSTRFFTILCEDMEAIYKALLSILRR